uniref:38.7 kDa protein n=1 Tax=Spodoptera frugiperda nuclear polyhedrosis virus TaxID=10455 RepID=E9L609_NPVSF|nr:38.7 kDa protein [Spodoptera frugiperda multiple nucleopolyhedrovirus]AFH58979.1 38.7 kDa protein [Spodoptera frugiperda multiple nucleopolyhedrovirus]QED40217.1 38.7K [Spodoptera frugiperda multiple nucleopolyhedrovirus]
MLLQFLAKLFGYYDNDDDDENDHHNNEKEQEEEEQTLLPKKRTGGGLLAGFSYLFKSKRLKFDDQFSFTINYLFNDEVWIAGAKFAEAMGYPDPQRAIDKLVDDKYKRTINELVFNNHHDDNNSLICINKHGVVQLLDNLDFKNKAEFITWIIEDVYLELENKFIPSPIDEKLSKVLAAVDTIKEHNSEVVRTNDEFKTQVIERFEWFNVQISELHNKVNMLNNVDDLYKRLQDYHRNKKQLFSDSNSSGILDINDSASFFNNNNNANTCNNNGNGPRYEMVRFPRDSTKHPRLSVFVKPSEDGEGTEVAFLAAQQRRHGALKRKFNNMEMIYDSVHPNPLLAMHCINEELDMKQIDYTKRSRRLLKVNTSVDTVKSFINENL